MHEAMLYDKLFDSRVRCNVCQWQCSINPNKFGVCRVRRNDNGTLSLLNYGKVSSVASDPIEKKPLYHFFPGSSVFSLGSWGCNFHCKHCQNWQISCIEAPYDQMNDKQMISPAESIVLAKKNNCAGLAWTYNEPSIWFEYTLDSARLAHEHGLYTVYVTNGYLSTRALDTIGPYLDAWRVDIKGFSDSVYRDLAGIPKWQGILETAIRAKSKWQMHVEVVTNLVPTMNEDTEQLENIARWIRKELGELTPWHITRFYPRHKMIHLPPTDIATLERAYTIGKDEGLKFVYIGNVQGHAGENTVCYKCGNIAIKRTGYMTEIANVNGSSCAICGADLNIMHTLTQRTPGGIV